MGLRVRWGDSSPKPADRDRHRDHEGQQFKRDVKRAQLAGLDVLNEFSEESHGRHAEVTESFMAVDRLSAFG
jgi:hypothetical protein